MRKSTRARFFSARLTRDFASSRSPSRAAELRLVGPGIDLEQQVALLDHRALAEVHRFEVPADPRPHLDGVHRLEACRVLVPVGELALDRMGDGHFGRWRLLGLLAAARDDGERRHDEREVSMANHGTYPMAKRVRPS